MSQAIADLWLAVGEESFGAASELYRARRWRGAINRAYFAVYARVTGSLTREGQSMPAGREGPGHARLHVLAATNILSVPVQDRPRLATRIIDLYKLRITADYRASVVIGLTDAYRALGNMAEVFKLTRLRGNVEDH